MTNDHDICVLNGLTMTTLDSMKGLEDAAEDVKGIAYAAMFADFAQDRGQVAATLQAKVRELHGQPEESASVLEAAHRRIVNAKRALAGKNDKVIIAEVERGENHITAKFEEALMDKALQSTTIKAIEQGFSSVKAAQDRARARKRSKRSPFRRERNTERSKHERYQFMSGQPR